MVELEQKKFRTDGINHAHVKFMKVEYTKKEIENKFELLENRRDLNNSTINSLVRLLNKGGHFETPLMINISKNKFRLIDGNHRIEACKKFLAKNPSRKIELWIGFYEDLTDAQEKEMYTKWNMGKKQSINDFIKQYWNEIPMTKLINNSKLPFKVAHCWGVNTFEFKSMIAPYLEFVHNSNYQGSYTESAIQFIEHVKQLGILDSKILAQFLTEFCEIFGLPDRKSTYYRGTIYPVISRIWYDNYKSTNREILLKSLTKLRGCERAIYWSQFNSTRDNNKQCKRDLLTFINGSKQTPILN